MRIEPVYINGISSITIQKPLVLDGLTEPLAYHQPHVRCIDPNFRDFLDPVSSRRMCKIIKRAIVTAKKSIEEAGIDKPDAIVTGTGLGCIEDTEKFLDALIRNEEKFLQPTYFIQSTHNTISSQIAINMHCNGYNNTYIHRGVSFENGLMDVLLLFEKREIKSALVTGNDEMTPSYFILLNRLGYWKKEVENTLEIIKDNSPGSFAGEGSVSIVLSTTPSDGSYARLTGFDLFYRPQIDIIRKLEQFLVENNINPDEIDFVLTGLNGDTNNDLIYEPVINYFGEVKTGFYKHICGEYFTASAYALLVASACLKKGLVPSHLNKKRTKIQNVNKILIYNHFRNKDHSFMLLSSC
jgi:3-oxoacyl-[acyl-carrier-protein] synthase II